MVHLTIAVGTFYVVAATPGAFLEVSDCVNISMVMCRKAGGGGKILLSGIYQNCRIAKEIRGTPEYSGITGAGFSARQILKGTMEVQTKVFLWVLMISFA